MTATWAVVVLYEPEPELLREQAEALAAQVAGVIYVDNGGGRAALARAGLDGAPGAVVLDAAAGAVIEAEPVRVVLGDGDNIGLAAAVNRGLARVAAEGAPTALLLDQDSVPEPGMVAALAAALAAAPRAAAVGPAIRDLLEGRTDYFVRLGLPWNRRIREGDGPDPFEVDFLITSGSLLRIDAVEQIGGMDERLFIDSVDFEWSFRAVAAGWQLLATFTTGLRHQRGDRMQQVAPRFSVRIHSAVRLYYMYRNRVRLYFRPYVPVAWKLHDLVRMSAKATIFLLFIDGRKTNLGGVVRGSVAGLRKGVAERHERPADLARPPSAGSPERDGRLPLRGYSVLMSVYRADVPAWLDQALASLAAQSWPAAEVVVVEDGPISDDLGAALDRWSGELPIRRLALPVNQGLSHALQLGLPECHENLIGRMDADDIAEPYRFELQVQMLEDHPEVALIGGHVAEFDEDPEVCYAVRRVPVGQANVARSARWRSPVNHPAVMFRRDAVLAVGGYDGFVGMEDYYLWAKMLTRGLVIDNVDRILLRQRAGRALGERRGGWRYARQEAALFRSFVDMGFMGGPQAAAGVLLRIPMRVVPGSARALAYRHVLRKRLVDATAPPAPPRAGDPTRTDDAARTG